MSPAAASSSLIYTAAASSSLIYVAKASSALANSPVVKAVTLSKNPYAYWRLNDALGNGPELVTINQSFELGNLSSWNATAGFTAANDFAEDGSWSAKVTGAVGYNHIHQRPTLAVGLYKLTGWFKTSAFTTTAGAGFVAEGQPNGSAIVQIISGIRDVLAGTQDWTLHTLIFAVTTAGTVNLLVTNSYGGTSTGTMWVDNIHCSQCFARDVSGSGNDLTLQGKVIAGILGFLPGDPNDAAMTFDGSTGLASSIASLSGAVAMSVGAWVAMPVVGNNDSSVLSDTANINFTFRIRGAGSIFELALGGFTDGQNAIRSVALGFNPATDHGLHFVGASWSAANGFAAVVDGVVVATRATNLASIVAVDHLCVGDRPPMAGSFLNATAKDVVVVKQQLSAADWSDLYRAGKQAMGALATASSSRI